MAEPLLLNEFLKFPGSIFDVRSPGEYIQGKIPGALNLPLFTDIERATVGTAYKCQGKERAIDIGLQLAGPKLADFVSQVKLQAHNRTAKVHCWRGGMRSAAMAWLLDFAGLRTVVLKGGYKVFRKWVLEQFSLTYSFIVIGGMTGCGKTSILQALSEVGGQVLDLETCANHRGSSYGMLGMDKQASTEQFENELALRLSAFDKEHPIWIEDESRQIGTCNIPDPLFAQIRKSPLIVIEVPHEERIERLLNDYGCMPPEDLITATLRISKRLGGQRTKEIIESIREGNLREAIVQVLKYYDSTYTYGLAHRNQLITKISETNLTASEWAQRLRGT